jgi:hypothetical protein
MVTFEVSELVNDTVRPPVGAGVPNVTANGVDCPGASVTFAGRPILPVETTVTPAVVSGMNGAAPAWMTAVPAPITVTGIVSVEKALPSGKKVS